MQPSTVVSQLGNGTMTSARRGPFQMNLMSRAEVMSLIKT